MNTKKSSSEILRQKAEEFLNASTSRRVPSETTQQLSEADTLKLIHELLVYQFELVMQNDELILAKDQALANARKYAELYDSAPSGYFTLSNNGDITELNFSGAKMLGKDRAKLIDNRFGFFVSNDTKPIFNLFLEKVFSSKANESCDVTLSTRGNLPIYAHLSGIVAGNGKECLVIVVDITESRMMVGTWRPDDR
ncbi:MAG: PAS domain-containing protein [Bacteroidota bacterium]